MWCPHCQQDVAATRKFDQGLVCFRCGEKVSFSHLDTVPKRDQANARERARPTAKSEYKSGPNSESESKRELWPIIASALKNEGDFGDAINAARNPVATHDTDSAQNSGMSGSVAKDSGTKEHSTQVKVERDSLESRTQMGDSGPSTANPKSTHREFQSEITRELNRIENAVRAWQSNHWVRLDQAHRKQESEQETKKVQLGSKSKGDSKGASRAVNLMPIIKKVAESNLSAIVTARRGAMVLLAINLITFVGWSCILLDGSRTTPGTIASIGFGICFLLQFAGIFAIGWLVSWLGAMIEGIRQQVAIDPNKSSESASIEATLGSNELRSSASITAPVIAKPHADMRKVA